MNIARPPNGFVLSISAKVKGQLAAHAGQSPWLVAAFDAVCARLRFTAHREGRALKSGGRVFAEKDPSTGQTRLAVAYTVLGQHLSISSLLITIK